jgi:hypothetical protein
MIAFDAGHSHLPDDIEAFLGIGIVPNHIPKARVVRAIHGFGVRQHHLESLQIGVDICYYSVSH